VPTTPRQAGRPFGPGTDNPPVTRPGGQPDGPPTVGGGEKARGNRYQNGTLERWDAGQQRWLPIAGPDGGGTPTSAGGDPTSSSGHPRISDLDQVFQGQPAQRQRYEELSTKPANTLSPDEFKFVKETRQRQTIKPDETMTKVISKEAADKTIDGSYQPDVVRGFVARARDTDQLRTPQQLRDGLGLDDSFSIAAAKARADEVIAKGKTPDPGDGSWTPIKDNAEYAYQMRWQAEAGPRRMAIPYGAPEGTDASHIESQIPGSLERQLPPFTGTGTTSGGYPEWVANNAPIGNSAQIWRIDRAGNRELYAQYDPKTNTWSRTR